MFSDSFNPAKRIRYRTRITLTLPAPMVDDVWRAEALREASLVRRAMRGARAGTNGTIGSLATLDALEHGDVSEILLSRRFLELEPASAATISRLAAAHGTPITTVTGLAEFELDLIGRGIAALLKHAAKRREAEPQSGRSA